MASSHVHRESAPWARRSRAPLFAGIAALSLLAPRSAFAQTKEELDKARAAFQEGMALSAANNCNAALVKFRAVAKVKMTAQVAFNIAECEERVGKLVSALGNYRLAASSAAADKKAKDVTARVGDRIEALEARIPKLTIQRGKGAETAVIELDGSEIGADVTTEMPVDPGAHLLVARIDDKEYLRETLTLAEAETKIFEVKLDLPEFVKPVKPVKSAVVEPEEAPPSRLPAYVALGAGGASLVVMGVFLGLRGGAVSELDKQCVDGRCPASAEARADKGKLYTGVAEVTFVTGVVGVGIGTFLLVKALSARKPETAFVGPPNRAAVVPPRPSVDIAGNAPGASLGGVSIVGRF